MKTKLDGFLSTIWGSGGRVFLAYKPTPNQFDVPKPKRWPEDKEKILDFIMATAANGRDVYYSPVIYHDNAVSKGKENVQKSRVLWVDFDGNAAEGWQKLQAEKLPVPTYRVQSGLDGSEHWYWILKEYVDIDAGPNKHDDFENIQQRLAYHLQADKACWNADRVMRPPFTVNSLQAPKYGGKYAEGVPADIIEFNKVVYDLNDFESLPPVRTSLEDEMDGMEISGKIPPIGEVLAKYDWSDEQHFDLFMNPPTEIGQQKRDQAFMRLAYYCAEKNMPDEAIYAVVQDVDDRIKKFVGRHDRKRRLTEMVVKARNKYPYVELAIHTTEDDIQQVYTINELLNAEFKLDWLVENLLAKQTINFISAESGIGKSRISMQLAEALASGEQFLDWPIENKIKTMYLSLEMAGPMLKHFAEGLSGKKQYADDISDNLLLVPIGNPINLAGEEGTRYIKYLLETHRPEVVMIDALGSLTMEELGEVQAKSIMNKLKLFMVEYDTTFFIIHHNRKPDVSGKKKPTLGDVYGNQYIVTDATLVLTLYMPDNQKHVELIQLKSRARTSDESLILDGTEGFHFVKKSKTLKDDDADTDDSFGL